MAKANASHTAGKMLAQRTTESKCLALYIPFPLLLTSATINHHHPSIS
jgi:hypothetical protein